MTISKIVAPVQLVVNWDLNGNLAGVSVTYNGQFTDSTTGTIATVTKGPIAITPGQAFTNALMTIYSAFPAGGL